MKWGLNKMKNTTKQGLLKKKKYCVLTQIAALAVEFTGVVTFISAFASETTSFDLTTAGIGAAVGLVGFATEKIAKNIEKQTDNELIIAEKLELE